MVAMHNVNFKHGAIFISEIQSLVFTASQKYSKLKNHYIVVFIFWTMMHDGGKSVGS
jgi:hypothetical protein